MKIPKPATAIILEETRTLHLAPSASEKTATTLCSLADKIEELVLKVGYSNAQAMSVIMQILTVGKVRPVVTSWAAPRPWRSSTLI